MRPTNATAQSAPASQTTDRPVRFRFRLFIAGGEPNSVRAAENLRSICEEMVPGEYTVEEIDVLKDPSAALEERVLVTPTLVVLDGAGEDRPQMIYGNLSDPVRLRELLRSRS